MIGAWLGAIAPMIVLAAPVCAAAAAMLITPFRVAWIVSSALAALTAAAALYVTPGPAPFGLAVDAVTVIALPVLAVAGCVCMIAGGHLARADGEPGAASAALALGHLSWFGWLGAAFASDMIVALAFVVIGWMGLSALAALGAHANRAALTSALRHLVWCALASLALAIGAALFFNATGSVDGAALSLAASSATARTLMLACALLLIGLAALAGVAPLNGWAAPFYGAGGRMAGLLQASVGAFGALVLLGRVAASLEAFGEDALARAFAVGLAGLGAISVITGSIQAIGARDARRLCAHAGAAQAGMILIAFATGGTGGFAAGLFHMAAASACMLGVLGGVSVLDARAPMEGLVGFGRRAPLAGAALAVGALGLMAAPLTLSFLTRWRLIESALAAQWWWAAGAIIIGSLAAVGYGGRLLAPLYLSRGGESDRPAWRVSIAPLHIVAIAAGIGLGLNASALWRAAERGGAVLGMTP